MNPFGTFTPSDFLPPASPKNLDVGVPWEYIRVINNSPYALTIGLGGQGTVNFPEGFLEDIPVDRSFNGKMTFAPIANYSGTAIARALANYVTVNAYRIGELLHPQAQPIGTLGSTANISQEYQSAFFNNLALDVSLAGNTGSQTLTNTFPNISQVSVQNPGYLLLGFLSSGGARQMIVPFRNGYYESVSNFTPVTIPNGGGFQTFQLPNATAITAIQLFNFSAAVATVGVDTYNFDRNDGVFIPAGYLSPQLTGAAPGVYSFVNQFGSYGFSGYAPGSGGDRIQIHFFNTTGGAVTAGLIITGARFAFDDIMASISYTDWQNNVYELGMHRISHDVQLTLDFLVPTPITNPAQISFGTLTYKVINTTEFYASQFLGGVYTIDFVIPANVIIPGSGT